MAECISLTALPNIPFGSFQGRLVISTNIPGREKVSLDVLGRVSGEIAMNRHSLQFNKIPRNKQAKLALLVYAVEESQPFELHKAECTLPFVQVQIEPLVPQRYYQVLVVVPNMPTSAAGEFKGQLILHTSAQSQPELTLPIQGILEPK